MHVVANTAEFRSFPDKEKPMRRSRTMIALAASLVLVASACGGDAGNGGTVAGGGETRTVEVEMVDIAFEPDSLDVDQGATVRFVFTNTGAIAHDAFLGDAAAQDDHEMQMREADDAGDMGGDEAEGAITVEPGGTGELTYTFDKAGTFEVGCHQVGHYDAGMKITVTVS